jgi:hypothetical protein
VKTRPVLTHTHAAKKPQFLSFSEITYVAENHKTKSSATAALLPNATWNAAGGVERDSNNVMWIEMFFLLFSLTFSSRGACVDPNLDCLDFYDTAPEQTCALSMYM